MPTRSRLWAWYLLTTASLLAAGLLAGVYGWLPSDGASGDLESFTPEGFLVRWVIESRPGSLQAGDVIVRAGGHTADEWLAGAGAGKEWRDGGIVIYEVIRKGQPLVLEVPLAPISPGALLGRWGLQFAVALAFLGAGLYVAYKRTQDLAARLLMLFCVLIAIQYVGDAYNIQFSTLPWRWPFWLHLIFEHTIYGLALATMTCFALVFPTPHPAISRRPALVVTALLASFAVPIIVVMALAPSWPAAVRWGSRTSWIVAGIELAIAFAAGARSARVAADPVSRAQVRWIVWCGALGSAILIPGYVLPLILVGHPPIPHPVVMLVTALIPLALAVAILRYRLFDIQVVTNRTLVYALLTALLVGLYVLLVRTFTLVAELLWPGGDRSLIIFAATFVVAMAVEPMRRRVQRLIDRLFFRSKLDYQQLLPEMSQRLATQLVVEQVATRLVSEVVERLQITHAELEILDADELRFERVQPANGRPCTPDIAPPATQDPLARYLRDTDAPLLRFQSSSSASAEALAYLAARDVALAIPLTVGHKLVGIYYLGLKQSGDGYTSEEVNLLRLLGRQAAVAVENARLFAATERQAEELAGLHEAAVALSSTLVVDRVLHTLAHHLGRTLRISHVHIWRLDADGTGQVLAVWHDDEVEAPHGTRHLWPALIRAILNQEAVVLKATGTDLDEAGVIDGSAHARAYAAEHGWQALLAVPLVQRAQVIGCVELWETRHAHTFGPREVRICRTMATDAAAAIEQARLFEAERQQRRLTEALQAASDLVSRSLDLEQVLDRILNQVARVVHGDASNIMLVDEPYGDEPLDDRLARVVRRRGYTALGCDNLISTFILRVGDYDTLSWMGRTGQPTVVPDTAASRYWHPIPGMEWQRAYVSAPIRVAGKTIGFLNVDGRTPGAFTRDDAQRLEAFAHYAATALHNARLYEQAQVELVERRRAEEQLKASLAEKEVLLKEVHHRVKNNLQVISSLLYFQARTVTDPAVLAMLQESQLRVRSMALVHEQLYATTDLAQIDAAEYVRTLAGYLFRAYGAGDGAHGEAGQIRFRVNTDTVVLGVDEAVPCGLLLHELISNALKHAFPDGRSGEVLVALRALPDGDVCLSVADNGIGLPPDMDLELGETAARTTRGLGLRLIQHLAQQLDGIIELHTNPVAGGTRWDITFSGPESGERHHSPTAGLASLDSVSARQPARMQQEAG
ncbi:MAG: GAF domain-containing protein [Anaerolineae bacterium]|nr:GAF domain-containing protein [Anaerolineae bacterium]